eukprot:5995244-Amphidinium_carterae.1
MQYRARRLPSPAGDLTFNHGLLQPNSAWMTQEHNRHEPKTHLHADSESMKESQCTTSQGADLKQRVCWDIRTTRQLKCIAHLPCPVAALYCIQPELAHCDVHSAWAQDIREPSALSCKTTNTCRAWPLLTAPAP